MPFSNLVGGSHINTEGKIMTENPPPVIGGKTIEEWEGRWIQVPLGLLRHQPHLREVVGLYRYKLNGQVVALGTGTDSKGGIAKRLSDFIRSGWSGRDHHAGQLIYAHRHQLVVEVLIAGSGPQAQAIARQLRDPMVELHSPPWNVLAADSSVTRQRKSREHARAGDVMSRSRLDVRRPADSIVSGTVFL